MNNTLKIASVYFWFFVVLCSCQSHSTKEIVKLTYYPIKIGNYKIINDLKETEIKLAIDTFKSI